MHDVGGGGGYGGTNWFAYDVRSMWSVISGQEADSHWDLVAGWRRSYELTGEHLGRMKTYRQNLAQAWPPEKNAAAAAYIAQLDEMIGNLQETYDAAAANYSTFATAIGAISTARYELKAIYDEYIANQGRIEQYEAAKAAATTASTPSGTPTPSPKPQASPVPGSPPVSAAQQEQLNNKARSLMYKLSGTLIEARAQIKQPTPYRDPNQRERPSSENPELGGAPPPIPPIIPQSIAPLGSVDAASGARTATPPTSHPLGTGVSGSSTSGPMLGGTSPGTVIAPSAPPVTNAPNPTPVTLPTSGGTALPAGGLARRPVGEVAVVAGLPAPGGTDGGGHLVERGHAGTLPGGDDGLSAGAAGRRRRPPGRRSARPASRRRPRAGTASTARAPTTRRRPPCRASATTAWWPRHRRPGRCWPPLRTRSATPI